MPKQILVVDDEELVARSLSNLLKKAGYEVTIAASATAALERIEKEPFDLIISDVRMPEMDGIQFISAARSACKKRTLNPPPEILISGYADTDKYRQALKLGVADYLYKPFENETILRTIRKHLK